MGVHSLRPHCGVCVRDVDHIIVSMARESGRRLLSYQNQQAYLLREAHIVALFRAFCQDPSSSMENLSPL
eukprot:3498892-Rhodomonas_salina.1